MNDAAANDADADPGARSIRDTVPGASPDTGAEAAGGGTTPEIPGYRIIRRIRQGGMATVYLAVQKSVGRRVALKVMSPALTTDPGFSERFYREAKIVGQLSHPNIVAIYDVGSVGHFNYIAMDYLPGAPLTDRIRHGLTVANALKVLREVAAALAYAHAKGYIHRDIKPDNILFRADGSAVLCDFGIARTVKANVKMTGVGTALGTPHYMSPEQAQAKDSDARSDLYSLGVVFFEMLTGEVPFQGDEPMAVAIKHLSSPCPRLAPPLRQCQRIVDRLLAKKPGNRYASASALIDDVQALELALGRRGQYLSQTEPTAVQVWSLLEALFSTLLAVMGQWLARPFRRLRPWHSLAMLGFVAGVVYLAVFQQPLWQPWYQRWMPVTIQPAAEPEQPAETVAEAVPAPQAEAEAEADAGAVAATAPEAPPLFRLTVRVEPTHATVRILNIKPRYTPGIALPAGPYHLEFSAPDYHTQTRWLTLEDADRSLDVALEPTRRLLPAGTVLRDPMRSGGYGPSLVVLPKGELALRDGRVLGLERAVAMGAQEISFDDFQRYADASKVAAPKDAGWGRGKRPVIHVSQRDAQAYAAWLSAETGQRYRLPTAEEWEYAARAHRATPHWWDEDAGGKANCRRGCDSEFSGFFSSRTAPVASYPASPFGLHDMAGNVAEWLHCTPGSSCQRAGIAGGSHRSPVDGIGPAQHSDVDANTRRDDIGFRILLEL